MTKLRLSRSAAAGFSGAIGLLLLCSIPDLGRGGDRAPQVSTSRAIQRTPAEASCYLFPDGIQDPGTPNFRLDHYKSVLLKCHDRQDQDLIGLRKFDIHGDSYLLTVHPSWLQTQIMRSSCLVCEPATDDTLGSSRFIQAVKSSTAAPYPLQDDGLRESQTKVSGSFLTGDLCPSHKPLDRGFFEELMRLGGSDTHPMRPVQIALSPSGYWIKTHHDDVVWLKEHIGRGDFRVVWINHSYSHPFTEGVPFEENFLLRPGIDLEREVFETEKAMIMAGLTPSVFFRFPGLISNEKVIGQIRGYHLIPVGSNAWLAKSEKPVQGSIILVHPNGNEPYGLARFTKLTSEAKIPLPFLSLTSAP